ncbi:MAG: DNA polymerase III subunit alpha [Candidatus Saccharibacteria bacterium]|nr:DNA polymerase III subunit alpha [Candidatus Saccharibacteria bacterium]
MGVKLKTSDYVHLHNHTHHSLLDGLTKIPALVNLVKDFGMTAVAITDHGTMSGSIEFYKAALDAGIKPIIGMEAYIASRSRHDRDPVKDKARYHLTILAMNNKGYQNLMELSSLAQLEGMYYKPRIDHELLEKYNEGLIILSGCAGGEVARSLRNDDYQAAKDFAVWYKSVFGDRYYLEMQHHEWDEQQKVNLGLQKLSKEIDVPLIVSNDGHYLLHEDKEAQEILLCVGTGSYLSETNRMSFREFDLHVTDPNEVIEKWGKEFPDAITNTKKIADRCDVKLELGGMLIPVFPTPKGESEKSYLDELVFRGLAWRYGGVSRSNAGKMSIVEAKKHIPENVMQRADYELGVVDRMAFNGYFLIVADYINWGKDQGIIFGPGRGSGAGSILAYAMRITELDPLKYNLLFERFLNPDRISMPDFDIDIQDTRRDEVIAYCSDKYGAERVANIVTFGRMAARAAVRDVARVLEVPYSEADRLSKMIPPPSQGKHIPLSVSVVNDVDLKTEYESNPTSKKVIDFAIRLEGTIRSHGVHAAGVVIAPDDIVKFVPLEMAQKGVIATQYPMGPVEDLGLLKIDFLGLSNLTTINNALRIIKKVYKTEIDLDNLPLDDKSTYELLQRGDTTGVFQLESAGMKRYLRELKPTQFDDIIAMVALYRPGPMQFIDSFIKRKHGKEKISFLHPKFEGALSPTYGILVYQEQFMQISKDFAGFTGGQSDTLRKAVGKKKIDLMKKMKSEFIDGAVKHSYADPKLAEKFWMQLEEFANYCFNKSHAACYGLISYWTAYLKAHYPEAFMAALMTSDQNDIDRLAIEINECKHMGITVLPPDINEGFIEFAIVPGKSEIRFGMAAVKGVGVGAVEEILRTRDVDGKFSSIEDFAKRVNTTRFNKKAWDSLIKSGGFDSLGDRSDLLFNLETIQAFASKLQKEAISGQTDLFGDLIDSPQIHQTMAMQSSPLKHSDRERLAWERELMGLYISAHPLDNYDKYFEEQTIPLTQITADLDGKPLIVGGLISTIRTIVTKSGSKMAFVRIEDKFGESEVIVFPKLYEKVGTKLLRDAVVRVEGKISGKDRDGNIGSDVKIIAEDIQFVTDQELRDYESTGKKMSGPKPAKNNKVQTKRVVSEPMTIKPPEAKKLYVHINDPDDHDSLLSLKKVCSDYIGESDIVLVLGEEKKSAIKLPFRVDLCKELVSAMAKILGEDKVVVK